MLLARYLLAILKVWQMRFVKFRHIHAGNFCGEEPLKSDVKGCVIVGSQLGQIEGQDAVMNSRTALMDFENAMQMEPFTLTVKEN